MTGPLMLDLEGTVLTEAEGLVLQEPEVGGVILFSRNFVDRNQLRALLAAIRQVRPDLLVAVDQEGGRVQRFREGFTRLPPMAAFGHWYDRSREAALAGARDCGWLLATELLQFDIDFTFAPVLDLGYHPDTVIGDRAFHREPAVVAELAGALVEGLREAGMAAVGKHFPGHGYVEGDSHFEMPEDPRTLAELESGDLRPFRALVDAGMEGLMPAHVVYPRVDSLPAGFSRTWLQEVGRQRLGFSGVFFSDDLSMAAAGVAGGFEARAEAALAAGCDVILVCNDPAAARQVLRWLKHQPRPACARLQALQRRTSAREAEQQTTSGRYRRTQQMLDGLMA